MSRSGHTDLLRQFGLSRNPFVDRTAEKTDLDAVSLYVHSDLQGFRPSDTTYVFFGRRGSGKTTIRLQMQRAYAHYNEAARVNGRSRGHFMVDLSRPGPLTACLRTFQEHIRSLDSNWDATFSEEWTSGDMVDCIMNVALTDLVTRMSNPSCPEGQNMIARLQRDPRMRTVFLVLAHLYATTDARSLAFLRRALLPPPPLPPALVWGGSLCAATGAAVLLQRAAPEAAARALEPLQDAWGALERDVPLLESHPEVLAAGALAAAGAAAWLGRRAARRRALARAENLAGSVRVATPQAAAELAALLRPLFSAADSAEVVRGLAVGVSAHQKLEKLNSLVLSLGYESLAVFGDCFDEAVLLDPVQYPGAIKVFAREICRNDLLNFGRMHFFFPDSRLALDLNTDKTLKEARFDRHFVRDLVWSRHQLEELAQRRFKAAQLEAERTLREGREDAPLVPGEFATPRSSAQDFADLFALVKVEDFSSYLAKLSTPRELMIMMTEMMARMEAHPEGGITAQDMEFSVSKALEQAV